MRKLIDIPDDIFKKLKTIAFQEETNPKNWIEKLINEEIIKRLEYNKTTVKNGSANKNS